MQEFSLQGQDFITLNNLLKVEGWCHSGATAKAVIDAGEVQVNGVVELRKRCKITPGQVVEYASQQLRVVE